MMTAFHNCEHCEHIQTELVAVNPKPPQSEIKKPYPPESPEDLRVLAGEWCRVFERAPYEELLSVKLIRATDPDYGLKWDYSVDSILVLRDLAAVICWHADTTDVKTPGKAHCLLCLAGAYWGECIIRSLAGHSTECRWKRCGKTGCPSWVRDQCPG